jgi:hypothetical protein
VLEEAWEGEGTFGEVASMLPALEKSLPLETAERVHRYLGLLVKADLQLTKSRGKLMHKAISFLLLALSLGVCQEQYISNFSYTNPILLNSTSSLIASHVDTTKTDSNLTCSADTCFWTYSLKYDTLRTYQTTRYWVIRISFTLFDSKNRLFNFVTPDIEELWLSHPPTSYSFPIDSVVGDTLVHSSTNLSQSIYFHSSSWGNTTSLTLKAFCASEPLDTISYTGSVSVTLPTTSIIGYSSKSKKLTISKMAGSYFLLNGRTVSNPSKRQSNLLVRR